MPVKKSKKCRVDSIHHSTRGPKTTTTHPGSPHDQQPKNPRPTPNRSPKMPTIHRRMRQRRHRHHHHQHLPRQRITSRPLRPRPHPTRQNRHQRQTRPKLPQLPLRLRLRAPSQRKNRLERHPTIHPLRPNRRKPRPRMGRPLAKIPRTSPLPIHRRPNPGRPASRENYLNGE